MTPETIPSELTSVSLFAGTFTANQHSLDGIDIKDYLGKIKVTLDSSVASGNNQAVNVKLQTSDELAANYADFDPAVAFANVAANSAAQIQSIEVDTRKAKRYIRAHATAPAAGNGRAISVVATGKRQLKA
jgi:hypothetical protein